MYVIIRLDNKKYYTSKVFGIYKETDSKEGWDDFYIVLNEEKDKLIKVYKYNVEENIDVRVLELNQDIDDLILDEEGHGHIDFLNDDDIDNILNDKELSKNKLNRCLKEDKVIDLNEYIEVKDEEDIVNLLYLTGGFHDACIENINGNDKRLEVSFDKIWGMKLQIIFEEEVIYKNTLVDDIYWFDCSLIKNESDYFVLVNQSGVEEISDLDEYSCYFMAKKMKYKIIPV